MGVGTLKPLTFAATTVILAMTLTQPAAAFSMQKALQAIENLGQWSAHVRGLARYGSAERYLHDPLPRTGRE